MIITIDDREQQRIDSAVDYYESKEGFKYNLNLFVEELIYGDYVFKDNDITVAFEFKTIDDYINSLADYRVFNQAINQSNNFDYHFVIIVGTDKEKQNRIKSKKNYTGNYMTNKQYYGGFASLVNFTSIIQVPNDNTAFMVMLQFAEKCCSLKPVVKRYPKSRGSPAYRLLNNNVHRVGGKTADRICKELKLVSIADVFQLSKADLVKVEGIGDKTAENILKQLKNEFS